MEKTTKRMLNTKEAGEWLGISWRTLEAWRRPSNRNLDGKVKGPKWVNIEGKCRYRLIDLQEYEESRIQGGGDGDGFAA